MLQVSLPVSHASYRQRRVTGRQSTGDGSILLVPTSRDASDVPVGAMSNPVISPSPSHDADAMCDQALATVTRPSTNPHLSCAGAHAGLRGTRGSQVGLRFAQRVRVVCAHPSR